MAKGEKETPKKWVVKTPFFDNIKKKEVFEGDEVEHTEHREKLGLIELK